MSRTRDNSATPIVALEINKEGRLSRKLMELDRQATLENTLLQSLYPAIRVATVDVPREPLDSFEQALVEQALVRIELDGVRYCLVGATGSAKNGKFYAVDTGQEKKIAERFRCEPGGRRSGGASGLRLSLDRDGTQPHRTRDAAQHGAGNKRTESHALRACARQ
jgi:hypothetical protein